MLKLYREIIKEFKPIGDKEKIIVFGSLIKGSYRLDSDIDVAIITNEKNVMEKAEKIADKILSKYGKVVSLKFFTNEELKSGKPFIKEVLNGKVVYNGG